MIHSSCSHRPRHVGTKDLAALTSPGRNIIVPVAAFPQIGIGQPKDYTGDKKNDENVEQRHDFSLFLWGPSSPGLRHRDAIIPPADVVSPRGPLSRYYRSRDFGIGFRPKQGTLFVLISNRCLSYGRRGGRVRIHPPDGIRGSHQPLEQGSLDGEECIPPLS
jgi:hypothetical protein